MAAATAGRLDTEAVFTALDKERRRRHMSRAAVCARLGVSGAAWSEWSFGGGMSGAVLARIGQWLDVDIRDFIREEGTAAKEPEI